MTYTLDVVTQAIVNVLLDHKQGLFAPDLIDQLQSKNYSIFDLRGSIYTSLGKLLDLALIEMTGETPDEYSEGLKRYKYALTDLGATYARASDKSTSPELPPPQP